MLLSSPIHRCSVLFASPRSLFLSAGAVRINSQGYESVGRNALLGGCLFPPVSVAIKMAFPPGMVKANRTDDGAFRNCQTVRYRISLFSVLSCLDGAPLPCTCGCVAAVLFTHVCLCRMSVKRCLYLDIAGKASRCALHFPFGGDCEF